MTTIKRYGPSALTIIGALLYLTGHLDVPWSGLRGTALTIVVMGLILVAFAHLNQRLDRIEHEAALKQFVDTYQPPQVVVPLQRSERRHAQRHLHAVKAVLAGMGLGWLVQWVRDYARHAVITAGAATTAAATIVVPQVVDKADPPVREVTIQETAPPRDDKPAAVVDVPIEQLPTPTPKPSETADPDPEPTAKPTAQVASQPLVETQPPTPPTSTPTPTAQPSPSPTPTPTSEPEPTPTASKSPPNRPPHATPGPPEKLPTPDREPGDELQLDELGNALIEMLFDLP